MSGWRVRVLPGRADFDPGPAGHQKIHRTVQASGAPTRGATRVMPPPLSRLPSRGVEPLLPMHPRAAAENAAYQCSDHGSNALRWTRASMRTSGSEDQTCKIALQAPVLVTARVARNLTDRQLRRTGSNSRSDQRTQSTCGSAEGSAEVPGPVPRRGAPERSAPGEFRRSPPAWGHSIILYSIIVYSILFDFSVFYSTIILYYIH